MFRVPAFPGGHSVRGRPAGAVRDAPFRSFLITFPRPMIGIFRDGVVLPYKAISLTQAAGVRNVSGGLRAERVAGQFGLEPIKLRAIDARTSGWMGRRIRTGGSVPVMRLVRPTRWGSVCRPCTGVAAASAGPDVSETSALPTFRCRANRSVVQSGLPVAIVMPERHWLTPVGGMISLCRL